MTTWLLSIGALIILTGIIALILPSGKTNKIITSIISMLTVLVFINPIFAFTSDDFQFNDYFDSSIEYQQDYLNFSSYQKKKYYEENCRKILVNLGVKDSSIEIDFILDDNYTFIVKKVLVNLKNAVIISDKEHIVIIDEAKDVISKYLNVNESVIEIDE